MTKPLSPSAQAVKHAVDALYDYGCPSDSDFIVAVLHALADQVVPANGSRKNNEIRAEIRAIAAELEGGR